MPDKKKLFKMRPPFTFTPLPNSIEDVSGIYEITELWRSHFKQLFNCIRDIDIQQIKCDSKYTNDIVVEISEVENVIKCLDINKTDGMDGVYAEHLKHCDTRIVPLLAMCITVFLYMDFYLDLCYMLYLLCWFLLSKINVARLTAKTIIDILH